MTLRQTQLRLFGLWCRANGLLDADRPGQLALDAYVRTPPPRITPKQADFLAAARRSDLPFRDTPLAVYEWGPAGAPYVHTAYGYGYSAGRWRHFAPQLVAAGYRVVAYDYPGHGHTPGREVDLPTIVAAQVTSLTHFGPPALALAHSFGAGTLALALDRVPRALHPRRAALLAGFADVGFVFRGYRAALGFGDADYASLDRAVQRRTGRSIRDWHAGPAAAKLGHVAALIAHDPADDVTGFRNSEELHAHWPGSTLLRAPGARHGFTHATYTEEVIRFLLAEAPTAEVA